MKVVRHRLGSARHGVAFDVGSARRVYDKRRHDVLVVEVLVGLHDELHIRVYRRYRGLSEGGNQKSEVLVRQRVELVLEGGEYAPEIAVDVACQLR